MNLPAYVGTDRYGVDNQLLDVAEFGKALAEALGGTLGETERGAYGRAVIDMGDDLTLTVLGAQSGDKARIYASSPLRHPAAGSPLYGDQFKMPEATVSASRPIEKIAADIKRRVIALAATPLANIREELARRQSSVSTLGTNAATLREAFPSLEITVDERNEVASVWGRDTYLTARMYPNGSLVLDRIGALDADKARRILAILLEG